MRRRPNHGFSLVEIILALGIGSIVVLTSGSLIVNSQQQAQRSSVVVDADQVHLINMQRSRNPRFLRPQVFSGVGTTGPNAKDLFACLTGKTPTTGCARFNQTTPVTYSDPDIPTKYFTSIIETRRICTAADCSKVQANVRTRDNNTADNINIFDRHSVSYLPGYAFVDDSSMDMTCAPQIMTGLNAYRMLPECGDPEGNFQCSGGDRILNIGNGNALTDPSLCLPMARQTCSSGTQFGVNDIGLLTAQPVCQGYASVTGAACVPSWFPRVEDIPAGTNFNQIDGCGYSRTVTGTKVVNPPMPSTTLSNWTPPPPTLPPTTSSTTSTSTTTTTTVPPTGRPLCGNATYTPPYVAGQVTAGVWGWEPGGTICLEDTFIWYASSLANCYNQNTSTGRWVSGPGYLCQVSVSSDPGYTCSGARAILCDDAPPTSSPPTTAPPPPVLPFDSQTYRNRIINGGAARSELAVRIHNDGSWAIVHGGSSTGGTWTRTGAPLNGRWADAPVGPGWEVRFIYGGFTGGYTYNSGQISGHDPIGNYTTTNWTSLATSQIFEVIAQAAGMNGSVGAGTFMITVEIRNTINGSQMSGTVYLNVSASY